MPLLEAMRVEGASAAVSADTRPLGRCFRTASLGNPDIAVAGVFQSPSIIARDAVCRGRGGVVPGRLHSVNG
jgi:hypothetical protein